MSSNIEIRMGDALDLFREIPDESIDLIVADPPYNLGKDYGNTNDKREFDDYLSFSENWLTEAKRVLKKDGTIYVFMGVRFISYLYEILEKDLSMNFNSWITWFYTQGIGKTKGFSPRHDDILMFNKGKNFTFNLDDIRIPQKYYRERNNMRGANPGNVWEFSHIHYCQKNRKSHPTQKPEGIIERMILSSSNPGERILDPFAGTGTTLRVCQQLNRHCIGFEYNPEYVDAIKERLAEPFDGFDSMDTRITRVPLDLRSKTIRDEYIKNHIKWFLHNHTNELEDFLNNVKEVYGEDSIPAGISDAKEDNFKQLNFIID